MAVRLRLTRVGGRKDPVWRVVVADQRSPRDGRVIETVGQYNAQTEPSTIVLEEDRVREWLSQGRPADRRRSSKLLRHAGHRRRRRGELAPRAPRVRELLESSPACSSEAPDAVQVEQFEEDDGTVVLELSVGDGRLRPRHRPRRPHRQRAAHRRQGRGGQGERRVLVDIVD